MLAAITTSTCPPNHATVFRSIPEVFVDKTLTDGTGTAGFAVPGVFDGHAVLREYGHADECRSRPHVRPGSTLGLWPAVGANRSDGCRRRSHDHRFPVLHGEYVQVGWFLTGEHRPYDRVAGAIDRVRPFEDFFLVRTDEGLAPRQRRLGSGPSAIRTSI